MCLRRLLTINLLDQSRPELSSFIMVILLGAFHATFSLQLEAKNCVPLDVILLSLVNFMLILFAFSRDALLACVVFVSAGLSPSWPRLAPYLKSFIFDFEIVELNRQCQLIVFAPLV